MNDSQNLSFAVDHERLWKYLKVEGLLMAMSFFVALGCMLSALFLSLDLQRNAAILDIVAAYFARDVSLGFGISLIICGTLFSVDRRIAARRGATMEVSVEGEFLRIREQGWSRIDRKMHLGTIAYYSVRETPLMRKFGIQTLIIHGTAYGGRFIKLPGLVDCAKIRALLLELTQKECPDSELLKPEVDTLNYEKYIRHMGIIGWCISVFLIVGALSLMGILIIPETDSRVWIMPVLFIGTCTFMFLVFVTMLRLRPGRKTAKQEAESLEVIVKETNLHILDGAEQTDDLIIPLRSLVDFAVVQDSRQRKFGIQELKLTVKGGEAIRVTGVKDCGKVRDLLLELSKKNAT